MLKYLIQTSIFHYSKNYGSLTHETRIKDSVNMEVLICLLATVRTLNYRLLSKTVASYHALCALPNQLCLLQLLPQELMDKIMN